MQDRNASALIVILFPSADADPVSAAPPAEHVHRPDAGPVEPASAVEECAPQPADRARVETGTLAEAAVGQVRGHLVLQRAARPIGNWQDEAGFRPIEQIM